MERRSVILPKPDAGKREQSDLSPAKSRSSLKTGVIWARSLGVIAATGFFLTDKLVYSAPYRSTAPATVAGTLPGQTILVTLSSTEHRPGQRGAFFRDTRNVLGELPQQEGLLGYSFRFQLLGNKAWTMTAWLDEESRDKFARSPAHLEAIRRSEVTSQNTSFVTVSRTPEALPMSWSEALKILSNNSNKTL
jgi:hypothetical protein